MKDDLFKETISDSDKMGEHMRSRCKGLKSKQPRATLSLNAAGWMALVATECHGVGVYSRKKISTKTKQSGKLVHTHILHSS